MKGSGKYETYELLRYTTLLLALVLVCADLKIPGFSAVMPFAMLPVTVCAGAAAYFHHKLPESKKCSLFSRRHPAPFLLPWWSETFFCSWDPS